MNQKSVRSGMSGQVGEPRCAWLGLDRVRLYSGVVLLLFIVLMGTWAWYSDGFTDRNVSRPSADFSVFWSASYLALSEGAVHAYDLGKHTQVMAAYGPLAPGRDVVLPWLYPPTFLLAVLPLALLPLAFSYVLFVAGSGYAYLRTVLVLLGPEAERHRGLWLPVVASPAVLISVILGQNSMLTAALAGAAVSQLGKRPVLAGVLAGLLAIKPQLALLVPVALVAGRHGRTLLSAAITAMLFTALSVALCGWETIPAFLRSAAWARENLMEGTPHAWYGMPSVLAAAQVAGLGPSAAYGVQGGMALAAAAAVAYVWSHSRDVPVRAAVLAAAALLATPYVRHYELTWMGVAVAGLVADGVRYGLSGRERLLCVVAWLLPLFECANPLIGLPQIGPAISMLLVVAAVRRVKARRTLVAPAALGA